MRSGQAVEYGGDLEVALEHSEALFDVRQVLVARHDLRSLRSATLVTRTSLPSKRSARAMASSSTLAETIRLIVGFHEAGQFGVRDRAR